MQVGDGRFIVRCLTGFSTRADLLNMLHDGVLNLQNDANFATIAWVKKKKELCAKVNGTLEVTG